MTKEEDMKRDEGENVTFPSRKLVHARGGWRYPTLCQRVMRWHPPIPTDEPVTCRSCLHLLPLGSRKE